MMCRVLKRPVPSPIGMAMLVRRVVTPIRFARYASASSRARSSTTTAAVRRVAGVGQMARRSRQPAPERG